MPGCCVRTGCDGSGRGPPIGACGLELGYEGRGAPGAPPGRGNGCAGGRTPTAPVWPAAPPAAGRAAVGIAGRSPAGLGATGRGTTRGAGDVVSGGVGVVGRFCSMRRRSVGGTTRPGTGAFGVGACAADAAAPF